MSESPTPPSETFRHNGNDVRVEMTVPPPEMLASFYEPEEGQVVRSFSPDLMLHVFPVGKVTKPTVGFAVWCPARFTVEGLPYSVEFSVIPSTSRRHPVAVTSLKVGVEPDDGEGITREMLETVPVARLLAAALNAAAVTVIHYPANYSGPTHRIGDGGALIPTEHSVINPTETAKPLPVAMHLGPLPATFAKSAAGVVELVGHARLKEVARIVRDAERDGLPFESRVAARLMVGERHARRLIQEARKAGLLPDGKNERARRK